MRAEDKALLTLDSKIPERRHDRCQHYYFIDSGYGECHYLPPVLTRVKLLPLRYEAMYPHVAWCDPTCSKFLPLKEE